MIHVIATAQIKEGNVEEYLENFKANIPNVLAEKGCVEYKPTIDIQADLAPQVIDSNVVTIVEKWESLDDLKVHLKTTHMAEFREKVADIVEKVTLKVLQEA